MKLSIDRHNLLKALGHVQSIVERRTTIPVLANVLMEAREGFLTFSATDLDIEIQERIVAKVIQPGATTAPAHLLFDIVRKLSDGVDVELDHDAGAERLHIRSGRSRFSLACLARDEFPSLSDGAFPCQFRLETAVMKKMIDKTRFAISTEETRYYLNGIYLHIREGDGLSYLSAVATDGHRLALASDEAPQGASSMTGSILPRKAVGELRKLLEDTEQDFMDVSVSESRIRFVFDDVKLSTKLIDGTFPDYERVIPSDNDRVLTIDPVHFSRAVDRVATVSFEKTRAVKLSLGSKRLELSVTSPDSGSAVEELEVDYDAGDLEIGFNARYLLDINAQLDKQEARFEFKDSASPTVIRSGDDDGLLFVLMPMRV